MNFKTILIILVVGLLYSCGDKDDADEFAEQQHEMQEEADDNEEELEESGIGIGPISEVELGDIDDELVTKGSDLFAANCTSCHKVDKIFIGPSLAGITTRRSPEWIMNMILNPEEMTQKDPIAKELFAEYLSPMSNQNLTEEEARAILEYLRTK